MQHLREQDSGIVFGETKGTIVKKPGSGKQYPVCFECQKKFPTKEELLEHMK